MPPRPAAALSRIFAVIFTPLRWLLRQLLGSFSWQAPRWAAWLGRLLGKLKNWGASHPRGAAGIILGLLVIAAGGWYGYKWYESQPKPVMTTYEIEHPAATAYDDTGKQYIQPLAVIFSESAAPVDLVGKPVTDGIKMKPAVAGEWIWSNDRTLLFRPKSDWPIDAEFEVDLDPRKALAPAVKLKENSFEFHSAPFTVQIAQAEFYQDPIDPNLKKLIATITFSHPVDAEDFKDRVNLKLGGGLSFLGLGDKQKATVSYDKLKLHAYVHSAPLAIPKEDTRLTMSLDKGIRAIRGGNKTEDEIKRDITVPGLYSLRFDQIGMTLVDNERYEPEQVLIVGSNASVSEAALKGHVKAWLLPEFHPKTPEDQRKNPYYWNASEATKQILDQSEPLALTAVPTAEEFDTTHSYKFKAPVGRSIYVVVDGGVTAFGGYQSRKPSVQLFQVQPWPQSVKLLSQGALLSLSGDHKLAYMARGLKGVKVEVGRLLPNQLHHLVDQNYGGFATPSVYENLLDTLVERYIDNRPLPENENGKPSYDSIDVGNYLRDKTSHAGGVFMIRLQGYDPANPEYTQGQPDTRFILVTDIGIIAKRAVDGSQDVFVQSIRTGEPISGARVEIVGRNGQAALTDTTDASGRAHFPNLNDLRREKQPLMIVVTHDNDLSFLPINRYDRQLNMSRFDIGGIDNAISAQQLSSYAFTDRGIYRPGETTHVGIITRTANWAGSLAGIPLEVEITDPRGLPVKKERLQLAADGFDGLDFTTHETSATGDYHVGIYLMRNNQRDTEIGSASFKVRDFEPDRLKVNVTLADHAVEGWIKPEEAVARVKVMHLFGSPANDRRVEGEMTLSPALPAFAKYKEYSFQDKFKLKDPFDEKLAPTTTDANGEATLNLNLQRFARATYRLYLSVRAFEAEGGRGVAGESALLVSSAPYLVGVKSDGNLSYIQRDAKRSTNWLAIDPTLKPVAAENLSQQWIERKYVSVLVKQSNGAYKYESRKKEIVRDTKPYTLPAAGAELPLNTSEPGDFALVLKDAQGNELNRIEYSVAGEANITRSLERNAELQLTLDKVSYAPGDTMQISIRAPYVGAGLITIERDKVYRHIWFKTTTTSSVQTITLPRDFEGNGYVSVQFVRDPGSDEIFMSPLSYGVAPFAVNLDARREPIKVTAPDVVKPGQTVDIKVSSEHPARVIVYAVDEGILQVARYKTPDPIGYFFQKRALQVDTTQILDLILPEFKQLMNAAAPGGDGDGVLGRHLNPFKKKRQPPVAYWSGIVDVDKNGKVLHYTVPDSFNGKLRIIAVAVNPGHVGVYEGGTEVRGDLILSANLPTMVAPGDEFVVSVGVFNNLRGGSDKSPVTLTLKADPAITVISAPKLDLNIPQQQEVAAEFRLKANDTLGPANLQFLAQSGDKQGKAADAISIRPATPLATSIIVGRFDKATQNQDITRNLYSQHRDVQAGISLTPLVWAEGLDSYLKVYPYSCTEQLVSQGMPGLVIATGANPDRDISARTSSFDKVIQILRERQNDDGSFGLWAANLQVEPFASVHAVHYLIEARERGLPVPADMLNKANYWLEATATGGSEGLHGARIRAYAIYLLTRQGRVTSGMIGALQQELDARYAKQWPQDITAAYLAASYKLMQQDDLAAKLLKNIPWRSSEITTGNSDNYFDGDGYDPLTHDAQLLYLISKHFKDRVSSVPAKAIASMGDAISNNYYHTLSAAYLILGFDAYAAAGGQDTGKLAIAELDKSGKSTMIALSEGLLKFGKVSEKAAKLQYSKQGDAPAFYTLSESGFDRKPPSSKVANGLEIAQTITGLDGKPITSIKVGEEFLIKLTFRSTSRDRISDVAIVDLLPGGMEPVFRAQSAAPAPQDPNMENPGDCGEEGCEGDYDQPQAAPAWQSPIGEAGGWQPDYADIRDDRVILYGTLDRNVGQFTYRVRATNAGKFTIPAPFAEGLYNRKLQGYGNGGTLEVVKP
ncbi:MAG: alpha-2-macroglobulin [Methylobacillus sp.]|jgi:uncharacterized protein YfaS (alpha-2-macroglobulin family)|nr:alpha-2-macroglobulin [Methylobacillus sp.]